MTIIHEISVINDKFATKGCKLKIEKRGEKLNIRGLLPLKENKHISKVQRISLGLKADLNGLEEAQKKLQLINLQLELNQFNWLNWINYHKGNTLKKNISLINKLDEFEKYFFKEKKSEYLSSTRKTTWKSSYRPYFRRMLSIYNSSNTDNLNNIFLNTLETYKQGSRSRKQCGTTLKVFADFLE